MNDLGESAVLPTHNIGFDSDALSVIAYAICSLTVVALFQCAHVIRAMHVIPQNCGESGEKIDEFRRPRSFIPRCGSLQVGVETGEMDDKDTFEFMTYIDLHSHLLPGIDDGWRGHRRVRRECPANAASGLHRFRVHAACVCVGLRAKCADIHRTTLGNRCKSGSRRTCPVTVYGGVGKFGLAIIR